MRSKMQNERDEAEEHSPRFFVVIGLRMERDIPLCGLCPVQVRSLAPIPGFPDYSTS